MGQVKETGGDMIDNAKLNSDAFGRWPGILTANGIDPRYLKDVHGPCPIGCGGKRSFRFDDKGNGRWICTHCGSGDGFDLLMKIHGWRFPVAQQKVADCVGSCQVSEVKTDQDAEAKARYMRKIWKESQLVTSGDPVWLYLERRCGDPSAVLQDLRYHPALEHSVDKGKHPAMLAGMGFDGKKFSGIQRTYLANGGQKAQVDPVRMTYGEVGPVRLGPVANRLGIAEGIETAVCASKQFGLPVWSGFSANGMRAWEPPEGVRSVVVCGDNDENFTGQAAAFHLARRLRLSGLDVRVEIPAQVGQDFADVYLTSRQSVLI